MLGPSPWSVFAWNMKILEAQKHSWSCAAWVNITHLTACWLDGLTKSVALVFFFSFFFFVATCIVQNERWAWWRWPFTGRFLVYPVKIRCWNHQFLFVFVCFFNKCVFYKVLLALGWRECPHAHAGGFSEGDWKDFSITWHSVPLSSSAVDLRIREIIRICQISDFNLISTCTTSICAIALKGVLLPVFSTWRLQRPGQDLPIFLFSEFRSTGFTVLK